MTPFDRLFGLLIKPWAIVSYLVFIGLSFFYMDKPIAYFFHDLNLGWVKDLFEGLTALGLGLPYLVLLPLLALFFRYGQQNKERERGAWFLWLCVVFPSLMCVIIKIMLSRARPKLLFSDHLYGFYGFKTHAAFWSFPSGHTTTVMGFVIGLCILFPRYVYAFILFGVAVAMSRLVLTDHFLSDVVSATYLAVLEVGVLVWWLRRQQLLIYAA